jgi:UDP-N-acetylglucosamine diphosphorylase / glucose-1-phosphate thymidylyltransferase / UDP-N-acetylgalactosamine diphosphorylase / glucosamine-1-phosphate N-acetyltransferase / galactosamine-1-phosphate N-acetyltransferase
LSSLAFSRIVVFDSYIRENFYPLSLTRPTFDFLCGTKSLLQNIEDGLNSKITDLIVPKYLEAICKDDHPQTRVNDSISEKCLAVNALVNPTFPLLSEIKKAVQEKRKGFVVTDQDGNPVFGVFERLRPEVLATKEKTAGIERKPISNSENQNPPIFQHPWKMVSRNSDVIRKQAKGFEDSGKRDFELLGSKLHVDSSAEVQRFVTIDTRNGDVILEKGARIESFSHITGPAYIGKDSIIKSAKIREGTSIGSNCRASGEIEESIVYDYTNKNHDGFIGHSILGSWVNLGALTTNSDLKNTYGNIKVNLQGTSTNTGLNKVGCFVGDMTKTAIGTLIMSGKTMGVSSHVFGTVGEDVPSFTLYAKSLGAKSCEIYIESSVETQRRMMERRNIKMTQNYLEMIKAVYNLTMKDRTAKKVTKGKFEL